MDGQSGPSYADTCFQVLEPRLAELLSPYLEVEVESPPALSEAP
jgi:hypothetical protein